MMLREASLKMTVLWFASSISRHLHGLGIPFDDLALRDAFITEESCASGAEAEGCVFDRLFTAADRGEEVAEVIDVVGVAVRRRELLDCAVGAAGGRNVGVLFAVLLEVGFLLGVGEGRDGVARLLLPRSAHDCHCLACDLHGAFRASEEKSFTFIAS